MPTVTSYRHGTTAGSGNCNATPPQRTECRGWSASSIRRNLAFLYSVDERRLADLEGFALTLTVRDCPPAAEWRRIRLAFFEFARRQGVALVHWVTEWQRRGVPHLHLAVFWPSSGPRPVGSLVRHWCALTASLGATGRGQHVTRIHDLRGWNEYVSKHAARGLYHYQRSPQNVPETWRGASSGRMWGKLGDWPTYPICKIELSREAYHRYRRLVRSWRLAKVRRRPPGCIQADDGSWWRRAGTELVPCDLGRAISAARSMLRCPVRELSSVRGISEWCGSAVTDRFLEHLSLEGHSLESV